MSGLDLGPGGNEPGEAPESPGGTDHSPKGSGPGPGATSSKTAALGSSLLNAVLEGSSAVVTFLAIVTAVIIGGLLIAFTSPPVLHAWSHVFSAPGAAFAAAWDIASSAYSAMFEGAIVNPHTVSAAFHGGSIAQIFNPLSETAVNATPLILAGLAVALAFRAGMFNIGATGQFIGGAMIAGWIGFDVHLPMVIHVVVAVIGGFIGGSIVGGLVGNLKARTGAHEVIVTIMLNYVMEFLLLFLLGLTIFRRGRVGQPDHACRRVERHLASSCRRDIADQCWLPAGPGSRGGNGVAPQQDDGGLRAAYGRGQPERGPRGWDEPRTDLGDRDAAVRRPRWFGGSQRRARD